MSLSLAAVMARGKPITGAVWGTERNVSECLTAEAMCRNKMTGGLIQHMAAKMSLPLGAPEKHGSVNENSSI